jgi:hypothetical protein
MEFICSSLKQLSLGCGPPNHVTGKVSSPKQLEIGNKHFPVSHDRDTLFLTRLMECRASITANLVQIRDLTGDLTKKKEVSDNVFGIDRMSTNWQMDE